MRLLAKVILALEPLLLAVLIAVFWFAELSRGATPLLIVPLVIVIATSIARLIQYRRIWVNTPINMLLYLFLLLCIVNTYVAMSNPQVPPYSWGWFILGRPLMGVALALSLASLVYERGRIDGAVFAVLLLALLVGILGLGAAQYIDKSAALQFLIDGMPKIANFPGAEGGFNVNEIAGAMCYFVPLAAGLALYRGGSEERVTVAAVAFVMLTLALLLGQSRLALVGSVIGVGLVIGLVIPRWRWRAVGLGLLALFCALELGIFFGVFDSSPQVGLNERDLGEFSQRPQIWGVALMLIRDDPLTGYGLNEFRRPEVRNQYIPDFAMVIVPHAHDEFLQVGTDTGVPGMLLYAIWNVLLVGMLWRSWRDGSRFIRVVAVSVGAGLLAHAVFGLADAITMYDRFGFLYWLFVGLAGGAYLLARRERQLANHGEPAIS